MTTLSILQKREKEKKESTFKVFKPMMIVYYLLFFVFQIP